MSTAAVTLPEPERLQREAASWPDRAREVEIPDDDAYEFASAMVLGVKALRQEIERVFRPMQDATHAAHKKVCDQRAAVEAPLKQADALLAPKLTAYLQRKEQERRIQEEQAREAQRRADEEARLAEAERRRKEAAALEQAGERAMAAEVLAQPPSPPAPPVVVPPSVPRTGVSTRVAWKARVTDLRALCKAIGEGLVPVHVVEVKQSILDAQAKAMKREMTWPGVEAYEDTGIVRRG